ncbi:MAG: ABC transporter ATP-binding protein/permease [Spirochaetaceae bacterium]|jgi:ABC-type bacteriocin/lantibiotic exporter with double-glycine peptidase domain|nr:ABC transporter ATP-binding protein/permease [Spirochaetaceae bacterium]
MKSGEENIKNQNAIIFPFLLRYKAGVFYIFIMGLILLIPAAMSPAFKKTFSNHVLDDAAENWLQPVVLTMLAAAFVGGAASYLQKKCSMLLSERIETEYAVKYIRNMLYAPPRAADEFEHLSKIYAGGKVAKIVTHDLLNACFAFISVAIYVPLMLREDVFMTFAVLSLTAASIALSFLRRAIPPKRAEGGNTAAVSENAAKRLCLYGIMDISAIKAAVLESRFFSQLISARNSYAAASVEGERRRAYEPLDAISQIIFMNFLLFFSALRITQRNFTVGSYLAFQTYAAMLFQPMQTLASIKTAADALKTNLVFLNSKTHREVSLDEECSVNRNGAGLRVDAVSFSVAGESASFRELSFYAEEGAQVAVAGGSDAAKTAFLRLLAGLDSPDEGNITVGGVQASAVRRMEGDETIGYAARAPVFFDAALRDNVTFWDSSVSDEAVLAALSLAGLPADVFAGGLEHIIIDNGQNLSSGERRRIELARALLRNPKILIVDDILYRMDEKSRDAFKKELKSRGVTLIASSESFVQAGDAGIIVSLNMSGPETGA